MAGQKKGTTDLFFRSRSLGAGPTLSNAPCLSFCRYAVGGSALPGGLMTHLGFRRHVLVSIGNFLFIEICMRLLG